MLPCIGMILFSKIHEFVIYFYLQVKDYAQFYPDMAALTSKPGVQKVWVSPMASYALFSSLGQTEVIMGIIGHNDFEKKYTHR